jgi:hemolysin activation/secretion protein
MKRRVAIGALAWLAFAFAAHAQVRVENPFPAPEPSELERQLVGNVFHVKAVRVENVTVLDPARVAEVTRPFENRSLGAADIRELQQRLTRLYVESGYVTSGVIVPPDAVRGEALVLRAVEGTIPQVRFGEPPRWSRAPYLTKLLVPDPDAVVHLPTLQQRMADLRDAGVVDRITAELVPLPQTGTGELVVVVEEPRPWGVRIDYDNQHSPAIGARRASLSGWHRNITGWGDALDARYGDTEGLRDAFARYSFPIPRTRLRLGARWERSDSLAIDPPQFRALDIKATSSTTSFNAAYALVRAPASELAISADYDRRTSETTLLGIPFSFIPGIDDGVSRVKAARVGLLYSARGPSSVLFARLQASQGKTNVADDATIEMRPATRFRSYFGQAQYAHRIAFANSQVIARLDAQYTSDILLPIEKYALGGAASVRGYRENLMLRDRAVLASVEWRVPVTPSSWSWQVAAATFVDAAWARNVHPASDGLPRRIASWGVGLLATGPWGLSARVYAAVPEHRWLTPRDDLQDRGVHFLVSWEPSRLVP